MRGDNTREMFQTQNAVQAVGWEEGGKKQNMQDKAHV